MSDINSTPSTDAANPKESHVVGFKRPPLASRFQPGKSGNAKGRPRGAKNFKTVFEDELKTLIPVTENGKRKKITKRAAIAKQLVNKAAAGDTKAIPIVLSESRFHENLPDTGVASSEFMRQDDETVMANIIARMRQGQELSTVISAIPPIEPAPNLESQPNQPSNQ